MSFWQELQPYLDRFGLVKPRLNDPGSDNGPLFTSEALVIANEIGELSPDMMAWGLEVLKKCFKEPGLLMRSPDNPSQEGPDDYVGVAAAAKLINPEWGFDFLRYGTLRLGNYNNVDSTQTNKESFLARQPQLRPHFFHACHRHPPFQYEALWCGSVYLSCRWTPVTDTGARKLGWLLVKTAFEPGWLENRAINNWKTRLLSQYPRGMKDVYQGYFGPDHPLTKYVPIF